VRPWRTHEGKIGGILIFTEDITSLKIKEEENHEVLEILNKANELIKIGVWKKNFKNNTVTWDHVMRDILEVPKNYKECSGFALEFYKTGKNKKVVEQAFADAINLGKSFDLKAEIITYKGNLKVIRVVGYSEFRNGECERLFGIIQDITKK
jgi:PAS domain-containing protein